jgi:hypothetical protein
VLIAREEYSSGEEEDDDKDDSISEVYAIAISGGARIEASPGQKPKPKKITKK